MLHETIVRLFFVKMVCCTRLLAQRCAAQHRDTQAIEDIIVTTETHRLPVGIKHSDELGFMRLLLVCAFPAANEPQLLPLGSWGRSIVGHEPSAAIGEDIIMQSLKETRCSLTSSTGDRAQVFSQVLKKKGEVPCTI